MVRCSGTCLARCPLRAFAHAVPSDLPFLLPLRVCLSGSCLLFSAQLRCRLLQEGAPGFSSSAHPCSLFPSPFSCTSFLHSLLFSKRGYSSCSLTRSRGPQRRDPVLGPARVTLVLPAPALLGRLDLFTL